MPKSLIQSSTVRWALVAFACSCLSTAANPLKEYFADRYPENELELTDLAASVQRICTVIGTFATGKTLQGRVRAGGVYTPGWMPGPDRADFDIAAVSAPSEPKPPTPLADPPSPIPPTVIVVQNPDEALTDEST